VLRRGARIPGTKWSWSGRTRGGPTMGKIGVPDSLSHGSSRQRTIWLTAGRESGKIKSCNTFAMDRT